MHQPLCIDYPNVTAGIRELNAKTYIKWINMIPHCHHEYSIARHISSVLKSIKVFNPITTKSQREILNSSQQDREGKTAYDLTILTKPAIHQDRDISRTWERERDQTHSYWYKPSALRVDYSLLIMVAAGMMKMATGDGSPSGRVPEQV